MIPGSIEFMQLVKIGAAAVTFALYMKSKTARCAQLLSLQHYTLMSYCVVQLMNPMWIDGLIYCH